MENQTSEKIELTTEEKARYHELMKTPEAAERFARKILSVISLQESYDPQEAMLEQEAADTYGRIVTFGFDTNSQQRHLEDRNNLLVDLRLVIKVLNSILEESSNSNHEVEQAIKGWSQYLTKLENC
jgi:hypothetical protein